MFRTVTGRWIVVLSVLATAAVGGRWARPEVSAWTQRRLLEHQQHELAALPQPAAAQRLRLLSHDDRWLEVIVVAAGDARPAVAATARAEVLIRIEHWRQMPAGESASRVAALAALLANVAPRLTTGGQLFAQSLAQRLLLWPIDGQAIDTAKLIADCQAVLELPVGEPSSSEPPLLELAAVQGKAPATPVSVAPPAALSVEPATTDPPPGPASPNAEPKAQSREESKTAPPPEPRRFTVPPRSQRISDE